MRFSACHHRLSSLLASLLLLWLYITVSSFSLRPVWKPSRSLGGLVQLIVFFAFCHHKHTVLRLVAPCSLSPRAFPWAPLSDPLLSTLVCNKPQKCFAHLQRTKFCAPQQTAQILNHSYRPSPISALNSSRIQMNIKTFYTRDSDLKTSKANTRLRFILCRACTGVMTRPPVCARQSDGNGMIW